MTQANPENYLFGYSYTGGIPPASMEVLVVGKDGLAQYVAGHPWPKQPPFDEIGIYQRKLSKDELANLLEMAAAAHREVTAGRPDRLPADSGTETFFVPQQDGVWRTSWNPLEPPTDLVVLVGRMRALISDLREHPLSCLRVCLVWSGTGKRPAEILLKLSNRGSRPFALIGSSASADEQAELHLEFCGPKELSLSKSRSPIELFRSELLDDFPDTGKELVIEPGEETILPLKQGESYLQSHVGQEGLLFGLLRIQWKVESFDDYVEEGWLMPTPLEVG